MNSYLPIQEVLLVQEPKIGNSMTSVSITSTGVMQLLLVHALIAGIHRLLITELEQPEVVVFTLVTLHREFVITISSIMVSSMI
jgi:hypothetical protein